MLPAFPAGIPMEAKRPQFLPDCLDRGDIETGYTGSADGTSFGQ
jgi:hypothetical protein